MSFWTDPSASFEQLGKDPWHSMENFATTGLVPMIPYVAGAIGTFFGGPAGGMAAGSAAQEGVDYFSGNKDARTGKGIQKSLFSGAGKGYLGGLGASYGAEYLGGGEAAGTPVETTNSPSGFDFGNLSSYGSKLANLLKLGGNSDNTSSEDNSNVFDNLQQPQINTNKKIKTFPYSVHTQPAFVYTPAAQPVQDNEEMKLIKLAQILRGENG